MTVSETYFGPRPKSPGEVSPNHPIDPTYARVHVDTERDPIILGGTVTDRGLNVPWKVGVGESMSSLSR